MNKYLKHLIYHLKQYGNVYFPSNRIKEFGAEAILTALKAKGYECDIKYFPDALAEERSSILTPRGGTQGELDAVLTLKERRKK